MNKDGFVLAKCPSTFLVGKSPKPEIQEVQLRKFQKYSMIKEAGDVY